MSDDPKAKKKKKGGGMKMILLIVVAMVVGGAGAAGGLYAAGFFSPKEEGPKEDPNKPVLVLAGESAEEIAKAHAAVAGGARLMVIELRDGAAPIGVLRIAPKNGHYELGYWIGRRY